MNLPNKLTIFRILLVPFFVLFLLYDVAGVYSKWIALLIFVIASVTDFFDGYIARKQNLVTDFGKFLDPLADKLLVCSAFICFVETGKLPAWMAVIIIAREFIISGIRLVASNNGVVIAAGKLGKYKTAVSMVAIVFLIINSKIYAMVIVTRVLVWAALVLTVVSLVDYIVQNKKLFTEGMTK